MPYIEQERRPLYDPHINMLLSSLGRSAKADGDLCYIVYRLLLALFLHSHSWGTANKFMGAVLEAVREFRRRHVGPYEDDAIRRNGDIDA